MYRIDIMVNSIVVKSYQIKNKAEAKKIYYLNENILDQYTRFSIDGKILNTAKAKAYLGENALGGVS